jgi:hypothetical protein
LLYIAWEVALQCKICGKEVESKFGAHINGHKTTLDNYFNKFPSERILYKKPEAWNKGLNKETSESVKKYAEKIKEYANKKEVRKEKSDRLKARYTKGDILSKEDRKRVIKLGSEGWVKKVKAASLEQRREILHQFVTAGNEAQVLKREKLTPEDYQRLYPWAKGKARWHNCDFCETKMICWFGGKPRPKKRFCNQSCWLNYIKEHPFYVLSQSGHRFFSQKMSTEFFIRSKLEEYFCMYFDKTETIKEWLVSPFFIEYEFEGKKCKYFPDFFVNRKEIIEVKSDYVARMNLNKVAAKIKAAIKFSRENGYDFHYLEFSGRTSYNKVKSDKRILNLFKEV